MTSVDKQVHVEGVRSSNFGHDLLEQFCLDTSYINLNTGSFGCLPHAVREAYNELSLELESMPDLFIRQKMKERVTEVRTMLASLIGAEVDNCAMIPNVAHGVNIILRNFPWRAGDKLIMASTSFYTISRTVQCLTDLNPHPDVTKFELLFPISHQEILANFRKSIRDAKASDSSSSPEIKGEFSTVALFDSVVSMPGVRMPWKEMVQICKEEGVWSVVDAAHSLGSDVNIELTQVDPDFWVTNCNKWLYTKRGCALLHVPVRNQSLIKHNFPPGIGAASPSNYGVPPFIAEFHWNGSTDIITPLTVKPALAFRDSIGGEAKIVEYCHTLAIDGGRRLAEILQTEVMTAKSDHPEELIGTMVNVALPLSKNLTPSPVVMRQFDQELLEENKIYTGIFYHNQRWWTRISAQVFNEMDDFEKLGNILGPLCAKIEANV